MKTNQESGFEKDGAVGSNCFHFRWKKKVDVQSFVNNDEIYAARLLDAWRRARRQNGSFVLPQSIFSGVEAGIQLQEQVSRFTPILWSIECGKHTPQEKHRAHHAYRRLCKEADIISICEQKLRLYETQAERPELSATLIATISKLNLMEHHIIQRVVALSSGLITNWETKKKQCKASAQNSWPKMSNSQILCCSNQKKKKNTTTMLSMSSDKPSNNLTSGNNLETCLSEYQSCSQHRQANDSNMEESTDHVDITEDEHLVERRKQTFQSERIHPVNLFLWETVYNST